MNEKMRFTPGGPRSSEKVRMVEAAQDIVTPPGGPRHRRRVRRIESGETARFLDAVETRLRSNHTPGPPDQANWITYADWTNTSGTPITRFVSTWTVPDAPATQGSQLVYLFNGIEPSDGQTILQPVLQWGDSGADEDSQNRTGAFWTVASWIVGGPDDSAMHTPHRRVSPGDVLVGVIELNNQSSAGFLYSCEFQGIDGTTLLTSPIAELVYCVETLEAYELQGSHTPPYDLDSVSEYPAASVTFGNIEVVTNAPGPAGSWNPHNIVTNYAEQTSIAQDSTLNGEVVISF